MGDEADKILSGRFEFVQSVSLTSSSLLTDLDSIWKPFNEAVREWPLALCDASSVHPYDDLVPADFVRSYENEDEEENIQVYYRDYHRWFYASNQKASELWLFRQYASARGFGSGA